MKLKIKGIEDAGVLDKERAVFKASADEDVGHYIVFKTKKSGETKVSSRPSLTFWFPDREIKKDDLVVLYSKGGVNTSTTNTKGATSHFFYWGQNSPIWNHSNDAVVLLSVDEWDLKFPGN
ncbi:MAG: hypothetical protein HY473_01920 [Candidatus Sungbacteria bacterium]|uniref:Uncharacterized protein n=1 Tax=Candidatus Sungiibacteriota bacterium TaxID=2750080 RepID=A0A933DUB5_9BACT|nr:hypothetical protein [Candidatus Sungbacteria bacterium]